MRPGSKSIVEGINFLVALHGQLLNVPDIKQQKIEVYGIMCPRWAMSEDAPEADARALEIDVARRRAMQSVRIMDAIVVLRELLREYGLSQSIPASELDRETGEWTE